MIKNPNMKERIKTVSDKVRMTVLSRHSQFLSSIPPLLIILNATTPYQIWYTPSYVGVVDTNRRECKRNHLVR